MDTAVARDFALERGISGEVCAAFSVQVNGAGWKWQTRTLSGGAATRWKSFHSSRPDGDENWKKYKWIPSQPDDAVLFYPPTRSLTQEIARANGRLYIVGGEVGVMSLMTAGRWNVTCTFGDGAIPADLPDILHRLGVKTLIAIPDRDESGTKWAARLRDLLIPHLEFEFEVLALPYPLEPSHGRDVNDFWLEVLDTCPEEMDAGDLFLQRIDELGPAFLPEPTHKTAASAPDSWGLEPLDLPADFIAAIESRLGIEHGYNSTGWSRKPVRCPFHDDAHPSAYWNRHIAVLYCFSGCQQTYLAKQVGEQFGLRLRDYLDSTPRIPLEKAAPALPAPVAAPASLPAPAPASAGPALALPRGLRPPLPAVAALTEADLALAATGRTFLDQYIQFAAAAAPSAPAIFHEALGLWLLSAISTRRVALDAAHQPLFPNLYILIVARTTLFRKSTAMNQAERVLREAGLEHLLLPSEFSTEALFDTLAGQRHSNEDNLPHDVRLREQRGRWFAAQRSFLIDEASALFALAKRDYGSGLHELLLKGYDSPMSWSKSLKTRGLIVVRRPCLTFMGATTPIMMSRYFGNDEAESGLTPRFVFVTPDGAPIPPVWTEAQPVPPALAGRLRQLHELLPMHDIRPLSEVEMLSMEPPTDPLPVLPARFEAAARARMERYTRIVGFDLAQHESDQTGAVYGRLVVTAKKVATLLAMADMTARPRELVITDAHAAAALVIAERWRESYHRLAGDVARASSSKQDEKVLRYLAEAGREGRSARDISRETGMKDRKQLEDVLTLLAEDGRIVKFQRAPHGRGSRATTCYRLIDEDLTEGVQP